MRIPVARTLTALATSALLVTGLAACGGTGNSGDPNTVTLYTADGLASWYQPQFDAFTKQSGIKVNIVESGSGEVVSRLQKEKNNVQADVAITLPPYIQRADKAGSLTPSGIDTQGIDPTEVGPEGKYISVVNNYLSFIVNKNITPRPTSFDDLLAPRFAKKIQYSTPGQAGDGTAVLLLLQHLRGKQGALDYLTKLENNNVGPSSSTGKLQPKVSNGELSVANGDIQMNLQSIKEDKSNFEVFIPSDKGARTTIAIPYAMGLVTGAPHAEGAKKLMTFLLSDEAQRSIATQAMGVPVRTYLLANGAAAGTPQAVLTGVTVWRPDWNNVVDSFDADIAAYQKAVG